MKKLKKKEKDKPESLEKRIDSSRGKEDNSI